MLILQGCKFQLFSFQKLHLNHAAKTSCDIHVWHQFVWKKPSQYELTSISISYLASHTARARHLGLFLCCLHFLSQLHCQPVTRLHMALFGHEFLQHHPLLDLRQSCSIIQQNYSIQNHWTFSLALQNIFLARLLANDNHVEQRNLNTQTNVTQWNFRISLDLVPWQFLQVNSSSLHANIKSSIAIADLSSFGIVYFIQYIFRMYQNKFRFIEL